LYSCSTVRNSFTAISKAFVKLLIYSQCFLMTSLQCIAVGAMRWADPTVGRLSWGWLVCPQESSIFHFYSNNSVPFLRNNQFGVFRSTQSKAVIYWLIKIKWSEVMVRFGVLQIDELRIIFDNQLLRSYKLS